VASTAVNSNSLGGKCALVVAHPDDEVLWFGGLLLRHPGNWTVFCCSTPTRDPVRAYKFFTSCERLGAVGRVLPFRETLQAPLVGLEEIDLAGFDVVVTHGAAGEYGHPHHKQVHEFVISRRPQSALVLTSCYGEKLSLVSLWNRLTELEWAAKLRALMAYDHPIAWGGTTQPSYLALITEYGTPGIYHGFDLQDERYSEP
jgi:LmbE family N-acetylglucosaminyl deacetylase